MTLRKCLWIVVSLMLSFALFSACGGGQTNTPEGSDQPTVVANTPTPAPPSPTPTPAATPTPSADDRVALGAQQHEAGQLEEAAATFQEAIELDPEHAVAYFQLGMVSYDLGKFEEAVAALEKAAELDPNDPDTQRNLGTAYGKVNEWQKAVAPYEKAIELKPDFGEAYGDLAGAYANTGKVADAIAAGKQAIELDPEYVTAYNNLGIAYGMQGDLQQAIALFQEALKIDPEDAMAHYNLGFAYDNQNKLDQAITEYHEAIRINPDYFDARENLGSVFARQNKFDEAIAEWQALLERDPERASAQRFLGMAYATQEKYPEAIAAFETYLSMAPTASDKTAITQEIAKLTAKMTEAENVYRNAVGGYSFTRPAGWYYEERGGTVKLSGSPTALQNAPNAAPLILFQSMPLNEWADTLDVELNNDPAVYLVGMIASLKLEAANLETGQFNGYPMARAALSGQNPALKGAILMILVDGRGVGSFALSPQAQWPDTLAHYAPMLRGVKLTVPEYRNIAGGYSLNYPSPWSYKESKEAVTFGLTKATLEDSDTAALTEGMLIGFGAGDPDDLTKDLGIESDADSTTYVTAIATKLEAELGNIETGEIAGYPVAYGNISGLYEGIPYTGGLAIIRVDNRVILAYAMAAPDLWSTVRPLFSDMLDSMTFFEP